MLRWMAPFLSFTAEEAWKVVGKSESIFLETFAKFDAPDGSLLARWSQDLMRLRSQVLRQIEKKREAGEIGSSLQAEVTITCNEADAAWLRTFDGNDSELKFIFLTSKFSIDVDKKLNSFIGSENLELMFVDVVASAQSKCERCWHYRDDVGHDPAHPSICGRCTSNLFGAGEKRRFA